VNPSSEEERLVSFLRLPASYPHRPAAVHTTQTHASWVFIASPLVFKVKKPVNFGFLDFETLAKRRHFCEREVELNRRLCPATYLGVTPIYRNVSSFSFTPGEEIAEYAVKMKKLADGWFLRQLLAKSLVGEKEIARIISCLCPFYESQTPKPNLEDWGAPEKLKISTEENFAQIERFSGRTISPIALETIRYFTNRFYVSNEKLFRARIRQQRIRDCHGDLRLDHVHLTPLKTTIFDCIEFNDRFRFIDVGSDLAFLAMDFDFEGRHDLGNMLLRNAARTLGDEEMLKITNFYKCYRAFVRGKVESIQATTNEAPDPAAHRKKAARYFRLALRYAISGSEPVILVTMGRVATGKSSVAKELGNELQWPVFSSDQIRKTLAGIPLKNRTAPELRAKLYSREMTEASYKKLLDEGFAALTPHSGVILDATFSRRENRQLLRGQCAKEGVRLQLVELDASKNEIKSRLHARAESGHEISDARLEDFEKLDAIYESPSELAPDLVKVSTSHPLSGTLKSVLQQLAEKQISAAA
jgi:aminoglycoside phosphotransferase family enzyme/predicted kinase